MLIAAAAITHRVNEKPFRNSEPFIPERRKTKNTITMIYASLGYPRRNKSPKVRKESTARIWSTLNRVWRFMNDLFF